MLNRVIIKDSIMIGSLEEYFNKLIQLVPDIQEVWLFGSRVDNTASNNSDWDILIFANLAALEFLQNNIFLRHQQVDLFVVYDGNRFKQPWVSLDKSLKERTKKGNLEDWEFARISDSEAVYWGAKENKMFRIWDKQKGWIQN